MTLTEFLLARIAEDEASAKAASHLAPSGPDPAYVSLVDPLRVMQQRLNPPRVLAECEAKRRIVALHGWTKAAYVGDEPQISCEMCGSPLDSPEPWPCETLRLLALPYADHPDFREEWRP